MLERCSSCVLPHNYVKADVERHSDFESDLGSALVGEISFAWLDTAAVGLEEVAGGFGGGVFRLSIRRHLHVGRSAFVFWIEEFHHRVSADLNAS